MRAVGWVLAVLGGCALAVSMTLWLEAGNASSALWALSGPGPFYAVGLFAFMRMPDRRLSFWLLAAGATFSLEVCLGDAVVPALHSGAYLWLLATTRAWVGTFSVVTGLALIGLFPSGEIRRTSDRWIMGTAASCAAALPVLLLLAAPWVPHGMYPSYSEPDLASPLYQPALRAFGPPLHWVYRMFSALVVVGVLMLYLRYRRSSPDERRRIRWLLFGLGGAAVLQAVISALTWVVQEAWATTVNGLLWPIFAILAVGSMIIALSHEGVLGIDRPARRSLVYRTLWLLIGAVCLIAVALIGLVAARVLPVWAAVLLTAAAALFVQPARVRLEHAADRWVFGARLDGYEVLTRFAAALSASPGAADLLPRLAAAVRHGLGLRWARVRLEVEQAPGPVPVAGADGIEPDDPAEPQLAVALVHAGRTIGHIECGPRRDGLLLAEDRRLLSQFAGPAATAVHNLHLTAELTARLEVIRRQADELSASRARVVQAQDAERRRIQRDLHDGVQQDLVAMSAKLALVRERLRRGDPEAEPSLAQLQLDLGRLLGGVREFAHAIHPPVLVDQGLLEAIEAHAAKLPLEVVIEADPALRGVRYPSHIEAATWYLVAEGLTNVVKHAGAHRVTVALSQPDGRLAVEVRDDGCGFDPSSARGLGLIGLADRMAIVDGVLRVHSTPGRGTALLADIPLQTREATSG